MKRKQVKLAINTSCCLLLKFHQEAGEGRVMKTVAERITGSNFQQAEELREERAEILAGLKDICGFITEFRGRRDGFGKKEKS